MPLCGIKTLRGLTYRSFVVRKIAAILLALPNCFVYVDVSPSSLPLENLDFVVLDKPFDRLHVYDDFDN